MFLPRLSRHRSADAWLAASQAVHAVSGHESHHVVIDIDDPVGETDADRAVIAELDAYLSQHSETGFLVRTVANTIFPQSTYEDHGAPDFYEVYIKKIFPKLKRSSRDWGRYFERMIAFPGPDGPDNLLDKLVRKMKRNLEGGSPFRNIYELPIYNPVKDADAAPRGGQCLSYLSFNLDKDLRILLSAVYRKHYYTEKLLGNMIGLGRLMQFVADETGATVGPLSILSTHAVADTGGATQAQLKALHVACSAIYAQRAQVEAK